MKSNQKRIIAVILCMVMLLTGNISAMAEGAMSAPDPNVEPVAEKQAPEVLVEEPVAEEVAPEVPIPEAPVEEVPVEEPVAEEVAPETPAEPVLNEEMELHQDFYDGNGVLVQRVTARIPKGSFETENERITMEAQYVEEGMAKYLTDMMVKRLPSRQVLGDSIFLQVEFKVDGQVKDSLEPISITFEKSDLEVVDTKKAKVFYFKGKDPEVPNDEDQLVEIPQRIEVAENLQKEGRSTHTMEEDYDLSSIEIREENRSGKIDMEGRKSTIYGCYVEKDPVTELNYEDDKVNVKVTADEPNVIPQDATLKVVPITAQDQDTQEQYKEVEQKIQEKVAEEEKEVAGFLAYDITFIDKDGNKMEPNGNVKVSMEYKKPEVPQEVLEKEATDTEVTVLHLEEDENGAVKQVVDMGATQKASIDTLATTDGTMVQKIEAETESFSVFTITWIHSNILKLNIKFIDYDTAKVIDVEDVSQYNIQLNDKEEFAVADITPNGKRSKYYKIKDTSGNSYTFYNMTNKKGDYTKEDPGTEAIALKSSGNITRQWRPKEGNRWENVSRNSIFYITYKKQNVESKLTTATTLDTSKTIKMQMFDYPDGSMKGLDSTIGGQYINTDNEKGRVQQGLIKKKLSKGYPVTKNGTTLSSLFTDGQRINHLFLKDRHDRTGYYEYDSAENYAYLEKNGDFTVYNQLGTPEKNNTAYFFQRGNFLPYTKIEEGIYANFGNLYDKNGNKLPENHPRYNEPLYFADAKANNNAGFHFGMSLEANFAQPANGHVQNGAEMIYEFNGDDDLWVFIDDVLILDIGGEHDAHSGTINFATGEVVVDIGGGLPKQQTTIKELFKDAKTFPDGSSWDTLAGNDTINKYFEGNTFKDFTTHTMKMFYMERGAGASNLYMKFNLNVIPDGQIQVKKELEELSDPAKYGDLNFAFELDVEEKDSNGNGTGTLVPVTSLEGYEAYKNRTSADGDRNPLELVRDEKTDKYRFYLQPGETAYFSIPKNLKYEVREVDVSSDHFDEVKVNNKIVENINQSYSSKADTVSNRPIVTFINSCNDKNLRTLQVEKKMADQQSSSDQFTMLVELEGNDGKLHPFSGKYGVTGSELKQTTDGRITLKQNEVAKIYNILSGTSFKVTEVGIDPIKYGKETYKVSEDVSKGDSFKPGQEGVIQLDKDAKVIVTNTLGTAPGPGPKPEEPKIDGSLTKVMGEKTDKGYPINLEVKANTTVHETQVSNIVDVLLIVDLSNSMENNKRLAHTKTAIKAFAKNFVTPNGAANKNHRVGFVTFGTYAEKLDYGTSNGKKVYFSSDIHEIERKVDGFSLQGGTNTHAGFKAALDLVNEENDNHNKYVIVLTDGVPTYHLKTNGSKGGSGSETGENDYNYAVKTAVNLKEHKEVQKIYTIGFLNGYDSSNDSTNLEIARKLLASMTNQNPDYQHPGQLTIKEYWEWFSWKKEYSWDITNPYDYSDGYYEVNSSTTNPEEALKEIWENLADKINSETRGSSGDGWVVTDTMASEIDFSLNSLNGSEMELQGGKKVTLKVEENQLKTTLDDEEILVATYDEQNKKLTWTLNSKLAKKEEKDNITTYTYNLTYYVTLSGDPTAPNSEIYNTNKDTFITPDPTKPDNKIYPPKMPFVINMVGKKVDSADENNALSGAEFELYKDEKCQNVLGTATANKDGKFAFKLGQTDLKENDTTTFYLKETKAPDGYQLDDKVHPITIKVPKVTYDNKGFVITKNIQVEIGTTKDDALVTIDSNKLNITYKNDSLRDWGIVKISSSGNKSKLSNAEFTLHKKGNDKIVKDPYYKATTNTDGIIDTWTKVKTGQKDETIPSSKIPVGIYVMKEVKAPIGYTLDSKEWQVTINNNHTVTISANGVNKDPIPEKELIGITGVKENGTYFYFENTPLYELPSTGGPGIFVYMTSGTLLLMAAALLLYKMKREEVLK